MARTRLLWVVALGVLFVGGGAAAYLVANGPVGGTFVYETVP